METGNDTVLVVSAHAADFVWRAGGAIVLYASRGCRVRVLCLSYGERGESEKLWKVEGMTLDELRAWATTLSTAGVIHSGVVEIPSGAILNFKDPDDIALALFRERT